MRRHLLLLATLSLSMAQHPSAVENLNAEEKRAAEFLEGAESELLASTQKQTFIEWAYQSNITDHNEKVKLQYQVCAANQRGVRSVD